MTLQGNSRFIFTSFSRADIPLMLSWLAQLHIKKWWPMPESDEDVMDYIARSRTDVAAYIVFFDAKPIGFIQTYTPAGFINEHGEIMHWLPALPAHTIGLDQFIGDPHYVGKGYGTLLIKAFIEYHCSLNLQTSLIIVDPDPENIPAIRCYEKVGFIAMGEYAAPFGPVLLMSYGAS
jgi:RimJ/RimL family protein N-acetyltransferase